MMKTFSPHYKIARRVSTLTEGEEFQDNRFVYRKVRAGTYVSYKSQDGTIKQLPDPERKHLNLWLPAESYVDCVVDFVPDSVRGEWDLLNKLGRCRLVYDPSSENWSVEFFENPKLETYLSSQGAITQRVAIEDALRLFEAAKVVFNGYRWFKCTVSKVEKISDQEAEKLKNGN